MRKFFRKFLPHHETVRSHRWLRPFGGWLHHPNLWHLHRRSVAGGVAIGLFCGLIPGPFQMISAALLAVLLRVNLPVAAFTTLYTNPLTLVPLYVLAYELGAWVSGVRNGMAVQPSLPELHWQSWPSELWDWLTVLGKPLLIGLPLFAAILAIVGYFAVRLMWRMAVVWKWRARRRRRIVARAGPVIEEISAMSLFEKIFGPKSKYDKSLPYTYEARMRILEGSEEYNSYFADTICGLVEYLHQNGIRPDEVEIVEVYRNRETPLDAKRFTTPDGQWLFKPDICHAFEDHYKGHIRADSCSFEDRDCKGNGP